MTTHDFAAFAASQRAPLTAMRGIAGIEFIPVRGGLWRVARVGGAVLGHIEALPAPDGERFQARRVPQGSSAGLELGTFWRADDAVECFR